MQSSPPPRQLQINLIPVPKTTTDLGDLTERISANLRGRGSPPADAEALRPALANLFALRTRLSRLNPAATTTGTFAATEADLRDYYSQLCEFEQFNAASPIIDERPQAAQVKGTASDPNGLPFPFTWSNSMGGPASNPTAPTTTLSSIEFEKANVLYTLAWCVFSVPLRPPGCNRHGRLGWGGAGN